VVLTPAKLKYLAVMDHMADLDNGKNGAESRKNIYLLPFEVSLSNR